MSEKPNCHECKHQGTIPGDAHSKCNNPDAEVKGDSYGISNGWFSHPANFDPVWLEKCDGFDSKESDS